MEARQTKEERNERSTSAAPPIQPTITGIKPDSTSLGESDFLIRVTGTGFTNNTMITINRDNKPTKFEAPDTVSAVVEMHLLTHPGSYPVTVKDGALESNEIDLEDLVGKQGSGSGNNCADTFFCYYR